MFEIHDGFTLSPLREAIWDSECYILREAVCFIYILPMYLSIDGQNDRIRSRLICTEEIPVVDRFRSIVKTNIIRRTINNNKPITYLALFVIGRHITSFLTGVHPVFTDSFCIGFFFFLFGVAFSGICLVATIRKLLNRQNVLWFTIVWIFLPW